MQRRLLTLLATFVMVAACGGDDGGEGASTNDGGTQSDVRADGDPEDTGPEDSGPEDSGSDDASDDTGGVDVGDEDSTNEDTVDDDAEDMGGEDGAPDDVTPDGDDAEDTGAEDSGACTTSGSVSFDSTLELWTRVGEPLDDDRQAATVLEPFCGAAQVLSDVPWLTGAWDDGALILELVDTPPAGLHETSITLIDSGAEQVAGRLDVVWRTLPRLQPGMAPHVLWIGIDGMRSDAHYAADTVTMDRLRDGGAWTYEGWTHLSTATDSAAGWTSLFTGVDSDKHLVLDNGTMGVRDWSWPTVAQMTRDAGFETAVYAHWAPITDDIHEDTSMTRQGNGSDDAIRDQAVAELQRSGEETTAPLLILHLDDVDHAGHGGGFTSLNPDYIAEIEAQDARVAVVLDALLQRPTLESEDWMVFVVTDHGGEGTSHGAQNRPHWRIPFLQWGTSVAQGRFDGIVSHMDVTPTALAHLGIASALDFDGQSMSNISRTPGAMPVTLELTCDDRIDQDGDRLFDCNDPDCDAAEVCAEVCADEAATATSGVIASGNNADETTDYIITCARLPGARDVGVSFTAPNTGTYRFDTNGTEFDTILAVYDGVCARPSAQLACNDDGGEGLLSQIDIDLSAGQDLTVVITGFDGASGEWTMNANLLE
ncbi:MAG: hypothetical protein ACI81R_003504 [Bradymonadia bacterium]|jgi:hypothetical protein